MNTTHRTLLRYDENKSYIKYNDLINFLKDLDSPIGDLCSDIISEQKTNNMDEKTIAEYLDTIAIQHEHTAEPITRLKAIYNIIYNAMDRVKS